MSQLQLLRQRRFAPLFWTQFLGALNDNFFKTALVVLITFGVLSQKHDSNVWVPILNGLLILPFFLFSSTAGQLADMSEKSRLIRWVKLWEIGVMLVAASGFLMGNAWVLGVALFMMGTQSAFFGPVKYGILPQALDDDELLGGNAVVGTGTFLAILIGTIAGGVLIGRGWGTPVVAALVLAVAVSGWAVSRLIPEAPATNPTLRFDWNPVRTTIRVCRYAYENETVFHSILGVSWFWFYGATLLTLFPNYGKNILHANELVVTFFLVEFCIGIGFGAMLCERMGRYRVELGLVPFGAFGLSFFALDLFIASLLYEPAPGSTLLGLGAFLASAGSWRIAFDLFAIAVFGGFYIVPLNALVQQRSAPERRSQILAAGGILSALFMVGSSIMTTSFAALGIPSVHTYLVLAVLNLAVAVFIFHLIPEFMIRFLVWLLIHTVYRLRVEGLENVPEEGAVLLAANHVTFVDGLIVTAALKRPVRFVMYYKFAKLPLMGYIGDKGGVVPICGRKENPELLAKAMDTIAEALEQGDVVCVFPEGSLTRDGDMAEFRKGIERVVERTPVPVVPVGLQGLWGSLFSLDGKGLLGFLPRKFWSRIDVMIGRPIAAEEVSVDLVRERVATLRGALA